MATHHFPVRCNVKPAEGLAFVPPFAQEQNKEFAVNLGQCPCGVGGNWYAYPEDKRQMYGFGSLNPLNREMFTIPLINVRVTYRGAALIGGGLLAATLLLGK